MKADSMYVLMLELMRALVECYGPKARDVSSVYGQKTSTSNTAVLQQWKPPSVNSRGQNNVCRTKVMQNI